IDPDAKVFARGAEVIVATTDAASHERQTAWKEAGAQVLVVPGDGGVDLRALIIECARRGWLELYCEGGARLGTALLRDDLVDRLEIHHGAVVTGAGPSIGDIGVGTMADAPRFSLVDVVRVGDDVVTTYLRRAS
ncbi:MAG: RibD family protein, partial [Actinomycetota bacterium]